MKSLSLSNLILGLSLATSLFLATGCVMTPTGEIISPPVSIDAGVSLGPRVHVGTRSSVSVWLHPSYIVSDAYPIAQNHCSRWGMYAKPRYDWSLSSSDERYLDYVCVGRRPYLSDIHIIGGRHHRRYYRSHRRHYPSRRVYTPKPIPRVGPVRRRRTFGQSSGYGSSKPRGSVRGGLGRRSVERGKAWEHNTKKSRIRSSRPSYSPRRTFNERGKAWEHNAKKRKLKKQPDLPIKKAKRSTFGGRPSKIRPNVRSEKRHKERSKVRGFTRSLKAKKQPSKRGTLRL